MDGVTDLAQREGGQTFTEIGVRNVVFEEVGSRGCAGLQRFQFTGVFWSWEIQFIEDVASRRSAVVRTIRARLC
jgi:hypothetical protein